MWHIDSRHDPCRATARGRVRGHIYDRSHTFFTSSPANSTLNGRCHCFHWMQTSAPSVDPANMARQSCMILTSRPIALRFTILHMNVYLGPHDQHRQPCCPPITLVKGHVLLIVDCWHRPPQNAQHAWIFSGLKTTLIFSRPSL